MKQVWRGRMIALIAVALAVSTGCAGQDNDADRNGKAKNDAYQAKRFDAQGIEPLTGADARRDDAVIAMKDQGGRMYVPVRELVDILEFQSEWDAADSRLRVGDNDVAYELQTGEISAVKAGETIRLNAPPIMIDGAAYIPYEALDALFGDAMKYEKSGSELKIKPIGENLTDDAGVPDFKDDPNDPFGGERKVSRSADVEAMTMAADVDADALINTAKKYIGVKYDFGAKPYPQSGKFDCSTYTQFVYGKHGVDLPRLSRQQGKVGTFVSRTSLRKGDLLFFYLPGRYKSNDIIGHVGIYMGDGQMIHASNQPKDGVQITSINKSFWKQTYLSARRVI